MSEPFRNDEERDVSGGDNKEVISNESKDAIRDESDDASSVNTYQDGVKAIEAISKTWTMTSLIIAYCRYAARAIGSTQGWIRELIQCQSDAHGHHYVLGRPSNVACCGLCY